MPPIRRTAMVFLCDILGCLCELAVVYGLHKLGGRDG
jgi:hypothetical protein